MSKYIDSMIAKVRVVGKIIDQSGPGPIHMNDLIYWYAFDSMGAFGFGIEFGLMQARKPIDGFLWMRSALGLLGPFTPAIWIPRLGFAFIPGLWRVRHWFKMLEFSDSCMDKCMKVSQAWSTVVSRQVNQSNPFIQDKSETSPSYIAATFAEDYRQSSAGVMDGRILSGDGANLLVAARRVPENKSPYLYALKLILYSDSTAPSIIFLLYGLAKHPSHADKVREELQGVDWEDVKALSSLPHLNGVINETLRLYPAIPTAVSRKVPPKGLVIDGVVIPGGTKLCAPRYSIHRRKCCS